MAKNNWKKHEDLKSKIQEFLKSNPNKTTNQIFEAMREFFPKICWDTVKRQLDELSEEEKITKIDLDRIYVWA